MGAYRPPIVSFCFFIFVYFVCFVVVPPTRAGGQLDAIKPWRMAERTRSAVEATPRASMIWALWFSAVR